MSHKFLVLKHLRFVEFGIENLTFVVHGLKFSTSEVRATSAFKDQMKPRLSLALELDLTLQISLPQMPLLGCCFCVIYKTKREHMSVLPISFRTN